MRHLYQVAFAGTTQSGKSSLANCLLQRGLPQKLVNGSGLGPFPTGRFRTTALPTCVCFGTEASVEAQFFDTNPVPWKWHEYIDKVVEQPDESRTRHLVSELQGFMLRIPATICRGGVCLIDTPGVQDDDWRREVTRDIVNRSDVSIVLHRPESLVLGTASPWQRLQQDLSRASQTTIFHVVNCAVPDDDNAELKQRARRILLSPWQDQHLSLDECLARNRVFFVDVAGATSAMIHGDDGALSRSGFHRFEQVIDDFLRQELRASQQAQLQRMRLSPRVSTSVESIRLLRDNDVNIPKLIASVRAGSVVPFVGAGLSATFGFPTWRDFLLSLSKTDSSRAKVMEHVTGGRFEEAAEALYRTRGELAFTQALESTFGAVPNVTLVKRAAAYVLPDLFLGPVVTTNYDRVIESVYGARNRALEVVVGAKADLTMKSIIDRRPFLLKIHGDVESRSDRIIRAEHYHRVYETVGDLSRLLFQLFCGHTHLFLGCSFNDDRVSRILRQARSSMVPHFAILPDADDAEYDSKRGQLDDAGVYPIWYPSGEFDAVTTLLEYVRHHVK